MEEIWKDIDGYEGLYQVSNLGRVKRLCQPKYGNHLIKPAIDKNGYHRASLYKDGHRKQIYVHQLVARAFIPNPRNLKFVSHLDETRDNNRVNNLSWATQKENLNMPRFKQRLSSYLKKNLKSGELRDKHIASLSKAWKKNNIQSKAVIQFTLDGEKIAEYPSQMEASRVTGINNVQISRCCVGEQKVAGGYKWEYKI